MLPALTFRGEADVSFQEEVACPMGNCSSEFAGDYHLGKHFGQPTKQPESSSECSRIQSIGSLRVAGSKGKPIIPQGGPDATAHGCGK
jgi:hypothetical protein